MSDGNDLIEIGKLAWPAKAEVQAEIIRAEG